MGEPYPLSVRFTLLKMDKSEPAALLDTSGIGRKGRESYMTNESFYDLIVKPFNNLI